jgi:uncharacterized protein YkwD
MGVLLKPIAITICVLAIAGLSTAGAADQPVDRVVNSLLRAHNRQRRVKELESLKLSPKLCEAAQIQARDMALHQMVGHTGSDGSTAAERIKRVGYVGMRTGENCAEGQWTVGEVMSGWMKSPGHRANILANYTEMGAAWARDDQGTIYWCVDFGAPRFNRPKPPAKPDDIAAAVIKQINRDREASRMVLLQPDPALTSSAMKLSIAMAANDRLETDADPLKSIDEKALPARDLRLKVSARKMTTDRAAKELHGADIDQMQGFREIGVGYAQAQSGTQYWCAIFARPGSATDADGP